MNSHDPYARLAAPRRSAGDAGVGPGRAVLAVALMLALVAIVVAVLLPLGPRRGLENLLRAPSAADAGDR